MFRTTLIASVIALGAAGAAQAQDLGPRLIGGGADGGPRVEYAAPSQNVVGGGYQPVDKMPLSHGQHKMLGQSGAR
jgi:hypothetical protein